MEYNSEGKIENNRKCSKCLEIKSIDSFYKKKNNRYTAYCKSCTVLESEKWRENNPDKFHEAIKRHHKSNASKAWVDENRERLNRGMLVWRQEHPDRAKAVRDRFYQNHRQDVIDRNKNASMKRKSVPGKGVTGAEFRKLCDSYFGMCVYCYKKPKNLTMDHVIPISAGGLHEIENIVPACRSCNSRKNKFSLLSFMYQRASL